jgi:hypothetical protein
VEKIDATVLNSWHNCGLNGDLRVPRYVYRLEEYHKKHRI